MYKGIVHVLRTMLLKNHLSCVSPLTVANHLKHLQKGFIHL